MTHATPPSILPPGIQVWERGWLSANNILIDGPDGATLIDSGYCTHAEQTLALVTTALGERPLTRLLNTHLHSDHCGGNAALQARFPALTTWIPPGHADAVARWDTQVLTYHATGQSCPRFRLDGVLTPGETLRIGGRDWQIHAAPGHDPHAILLFQADHGVLISGDALWENGFGVVFPELDGDSAFAEVGATLDLIEALQPRVVIPGHGRPFGGTDAITAAIGRARSRLRQFMDAPDKHLRYAWKVLLKFKLLEWQRAPRDAFMAWAMQTPYLVQQHERHGEGDMAQWLERLLQELAASGAARLEPGWIIDA
ncbi:MBL fold metallo-hydrolase [Tepidicella baoligensis]|uniref:MBL fold metallo-hydrolase n=1 Tax=Tepidicella baoligensis TaxID=2707016 RepID=UPI0015D98195|nr:MBL fold metallo-hydrolase [Tepidicella baoligensis]